MAHPRAQTKASDDSRFDTSWLTSPKTSTPAAPSAFSACQRHSNTVAAAHKLHHCGPQTLLVLHNLLSLASNRL